MRFSYILLTKTFFKLNTSAKTRPWRIPGQKQNKLTQLSQFKPKIHIQPKIIIYKMFKASYLSYFGTIVIVAGFGTSVLLYKYTNYQFCLHRTDFAKAALKVFNEQKKLLNLIGTPYELGVIQPLEKNGIQDHSVSISIPIIGKISKGVILCKVEKENDQWTVKNMKFQFTDKRGGIVRIV